jgi:deoxyribonuclease V
LNIPHWPKTISEAKVVQNDLKNKVRIIPLSKNPRFIAGVDAAFAGDRIIGTACLFRYPEVTLVGEAYAEMRNLFPYVPGFLSFREGPVIIETIQKLPIKPDVILFDGQGIAHPLGLGIASHIGLLLNIPAIGCAKSRLVGEYTEPAVQRGSSSLLFYHNKPVGAVLRTRDNVKPLFISPGHRIDMKASIEIVLNCLSKYRIPEPLRRADFLSKSLKREQR